MWEKAKPTMEAPCRVGVLPVDLHVVQCRSTPSIIAATSEAEQALSWEWTHSDFFSTCL